MACEEKGRVMLLVRVPASLQEALRMESRRRGQTMTAIVERAIRREIGNPRIGEMVAGRIRAAK
jgi:hypothetical protein